MRTSVYVHFPWCLKKCPYCDFASASVRRGEVAHEAYALAVGQELEARDVSGRDLFSVFFGGGTPSLWAPEALGRTLEAILDAFDDVAPEVEVTVECNPTSIDLDRARALRAVGVNRLSIGVQSLDDDRLRFLGRLHDAAGARRALTAALEAGLRVSGDLMFGMPGQTPDDFERELRELVDLGVQHVSAYALTIEPDTQFGALHRKGKLRLAREDDYADTFTRAQELFEQLGWTHYEVSNYAKPGAEARHNQHYWRGGDYLGLGAGAVGTMSRGSRARRTQNDPRPERYLANPAEAVVFEEELGPSDRIGEALMLGLRTAEGVDLDALSARVGRDPRSQREEAIARRSASGDVTVDDGVLRVPASRWLHLDSIIADMF